MCYNIIVRETQDNFLEAINMCFETRVGLIVLGIVVIGYLASRLLSRINWPMVYFALCGGMENDR